MAIENVRRFEEKINGDEALQARLKELSDAFDGDRQDPRAVFEAVEYVDQRDDEDLTADEAKAVAGGWVACVIVGFGGLEADTCGGNEWTGAAACAGLGVGMSAI